MNTILPSVKTRKPFFGISGLKSLSVWVMLIFSWYYFPTPSMTFCIVALASVLGVAFKMYSFQRNSNLQHTVNPIPVKSSYFTATGNARQSCFSSPVNLPAQQS